MKAFVAFLAGLGIIGYIAIIALAIFSFIATIYGAIVTFSTSVIMGIIFFFTGGGYFLVGAGKLIFGVNLAEMILKAING